MFSDLLIQPSSFMWGQAQPAPCTQHLVNVISSPVNTMPRYSFPTTNLSISFLWTHVFRFIYLGFLTKNLKKKTWCKASYLLSHLKPKRLLHVGDALGDKVTRGGRWPGRWCSVVSYDGGPLLMSHWILSWLIWPHSTYSATIPGTGQQQQPAREMQKIWQVHIAPPPPPHCSRHYDGCWALIRTFT